MYYTVISAIKNSSNRTLGYKLKDNYGTIADYSNKEIKDIIQNGSIVDGLKISKNNKLLVDKNRKFIASVDGSNIISIEVGDALIRRCFNDVKNFKPRDIVNNIVNFSISDQYNRLYIIHGIRRTGKTVSMQHSILELKRRGISSNALYMITVAGEVKFQVLINILLNIKDAIVFIDEVTNIKDIIQSLNYISDILASANRLKIILSGTDSFVFPIAQTSSLYGRTYTSHSTLISYREYVRLFGLSICSSSYEMYTKDGSIYSNQFNGNTALVRTINSTIIKNITNTINRNKTFFISNTTYNRMVKFKEEELHFLIYSILTSVVSPKSNNNICKIIKTLSKQKLAFLANACRTDTEDIPSTMNKVKSNDILSLIDVLSKLDILRLVPNIAHYTISDTQESLGYNAVTDYEICVTIPGLLYTIENTMKARKSDLDGNITENTVLANLYMLQPRNNNRIVDISYLKYQVNGIEHEIDAVVTVQDSNFENYYTLIEIKHGSTPFEKFAQHLVTKDIPDGIKDKTKNKIVVYFGKTTVVRGIKYVNILEFLIYTWKYIVQ